MFFLFWSSFYIREDNFGREGKESMQQRGSITSCVKFFLFLHCYFRFLLLVSGQQFFIVLTFGFCKDNLLLSIYTNAKRYTMGFLYYEETIGYDIGSEYTKCTNNIEQPDKKILRVGFYVHDARGMTAQSVLHSSNILITGVIINV